MTYLKKNQDRFFDIVSKKIKIVRKKPGPKIGIAALMFLNKIEKKSPKLREEIVV
jgi:hypothetical protein